MGVAIALRGDFDGPGLRRLAEAAKDVGQSRRGLAPGGIYDGGARSDAARMSGVGLSGDPGLGGFVSMPMVRTGRLTARHRARRPSSTARNAERLHGSPGTGRSRRPMVRCAGASRTSHNGYWRNSASRWTRPPWAGS